MSKRKFHELVFITNLFYEEQQNLKNILRFDSLDPSNMFYIYLKYKC